MSYKQMSKTTGLCERTCINQMDNLVNQNVVKVVASKVPDELSYYKPNSYKLLLRESPIEEADNNKSIEFEYTGKSKIRKQYLDGLKLLDDNTLRTQLSKNGLHLFKRNRYIKL